MLMLFHFWSLLATVSTTAMTRSCVSPSTPSSCVWESRDFQEDGQEESSSSSSLCFRDWHTFWNQEPSPCNAVERVMDVILSRVATAAATMVSSSAEPSLLMNFESSSSSDLEGEDVPDIFRSFYRGQLVSFTEQPTATNRQPPKKLKRKTVTFRLDLAYRGTHFCGWQTQDKDGSRDLPLPAVQDVVSAALNGRDIRVAGRTDAGVSAVGQVARVRMGLPDVNAEQVFEQLLQAATSASKTGNGASWFCRRVVQESDKFHPAFGARSRSYIYLIDATEQLEQTSGTTIDELVSRLNALFAPLYNQTLPYFALSYGRIKTQTSECTLCHVRARHLRLDDQSVVAIELTGDRFLRRMIRILVASALDLAAVASDHSSSRAPTDDASSDGNSLLGLVQSQDRRLSSKPAPAQGLIFVSASYEAMEG